MFWLEATGDVSVVPTDDLPHGNKWKPSKVSPGRDRVMHTTTGTKLSVSIILASMITDDY